MQGLCHLLFNYCTCFCFSSVFFLLFWNGRNKIRRMHHGWDSCTGRPRSTWDFETWWNKFGLKFVIVILMLFSTRFRNYFHLMSYFKGFPELVSYFFFDIALTRQFVFKWFNFLKGLSQVYTRAWLTPRNFDSELRLPQLLTGQPPPPKRTPPEIRPYSGLINYWFPSIRPAIKPLFLRGVWLISHKYHLPKKALQRAFA